MFKYGLELEGFFRENGEVCVPPTNYPTDGYPGLVELRTSGGAALDVCYSEIIRLNLKYPSCDYSTPVHTFHPKDKALIRRRHSEKREVDIQNLYGRNPRSLGNKTIASLQISISNMLHDAYTAKEGHQVPASYGLLDIPKIVRSLDEEFKAEIKASGRQPGEYAVKSSIRLEYRSLPNSVFPFDAAEARKFLQRVRSAVDA